MTDGVENERNALVVSDFWRDIEHRAVRSVCLASVAALRERAGREVLRRRFLDAKPADVDGPPIRGSRFVESAANEFVLFSRGYRLLESRFLGCRCCTPRLGVGLPGQHESASLHTRQKCDFLRLYVSGCGI